MLSLKKFLGETSLHGFSYADEKNKFVVAFWALATFACVTLAANDIVGLVQTYQSVPFQVNLTPQPNNNVSLPTPTLCMEIMVIPPTNIISPTEIESDIQTFMYRTGNGTNHSFLSSVDMGLTDNLEYLTYMMLGFIYDFEMVYVQPNDQIYTDYATRYITGNQDIWSLTQIAFNIYAQYDVSLVDLKLLVGSSICQKQFKKAQRGKLLIKNLGPLQICQPDTLTHLSFSLVCSSVLDTKTFSTSDFHTFSVGQMVSASDPDPLLMFPAVVMPQMCQSIAQPMGQFISDFAANLVESVLIGADGSPANVVRYLWHLDLQGRPALSPDSLQDIITIDPQIPMQKFDVSVATEFNFYDVPSVRPCVTQESQQQCRWKKVVERMSQTCGCWPSTIIGMSNADQLPNCNINPSLNPYLSNNNTTQYSGSGRCDYGLETLVDDSECPKQCQSFLYTINVVDAYRHVNLTTMKTPYLHDYNRVSSSFEVTYQIGSFRTVIREIPTMSFTLFACSFGGSIGTWLGLQKGCQLMSMCNDYELNLGGSILAFVHVPIFIMSQLYDHYANRKKVRNIVEADDNVNPIAKEIIYPPTSTEATGL